MGPRGYLLAYLLILMFLLVISIWVHLAKIGALEAYSEKNIQFSGPKNRHLGFSLQLISIFVLLNTWLAAIAYIHTVIDDQYFCVDPGRNYRNHMEMVWLSDLLLLLNLGLFFSLKNYPKLRRRHWYLFVTLGLTIGINLFIGFVHNSSIKF